MIAMVKGTLMEKSEGEARCDDRRRPGPARDVQHEHARRAACRGQECTLYTFMNVREDAMELFGFCQKEERDMFKRLTSVSGIGPRSALACWAACRWRICAWPSSPGDAAALSPRAGHRQENGAAH